MVVPNYHRGQGQGWSLSQFFLVPSCFLTLVLLNLRCLSGILPRNSPSWKKGRAVGIKGGKKKNGQRDCHFSSGAVRKSVGTYVILLLPLYSHTLIHDERIVAAPFRNFLGAST